MTRHSACCPAVLISNFLCEKVHIDLWHVIDLENFWGKSHYIRINNAVCGSGMLIPDPGSRVKKIPDPGCGSKNVSTNPNKCF
jgi:hypothetical protein